MYTQDCPWHCGKRSRCFLHGDVWQTQSRKERQTAFVRHDIAVYPLGRIEHNSRSPSFGFEDCL